MRIWNSLFIILFYFVLVKLSLSSASTALRRCLFLILQISCVSSCTFNLSFALYPTSVDASLPIRPPCFCSFFPPPHPSSTHETPPYRRGLIHVTSRYQKQGLTFFPSRGVIHRENLTPASVSARDAIDSEPITNANERRPHPRPRHASHPYLPRTRHPHHSFKVQVTALFAATSDLPRFPFGGGV